MADSKKVKKTPSKAGAQSDDEDMDEESDEDQNSDLELLPSYQLLLSLLSLLTKTEALKSRTLALTSQMMKELSAFILTISKQETKQILKQKELTQQLFSLYQSAVMRTATTVNASESEILEDLPLKDCLLDYTSLVVSLFDGAYEELLQDGAPYLRAITQAGTPSYGFLSCLLLMARAAKDKRINITETLEIDCSAPKTSGSAIYLLKKVLLHCLEKE